MADKLPDPLERLIHELSRLPTIGKKSAQRLAFHLLKAPDQRARELATALIDVRERLRFCRQCGFIAEGDLCSICTDERRDPTLLCVVEEPFDVLALERGGAFKGSYHVLMGRLSPLQGITPDDLNIASLLDRIDSSKTTDTPVREVILATNPNVDGDATALYLSRLITAHGVSCTRLGLGLAVGSSLEFADELTLRQALDSRRALEKPMP